MTIFYCSAIIYCSASLGGDIGVQLAAFKQKLSRVYDYRSVSDGGVKTAIEVTGVGAGLDETLDCMAKLGRVALLGCTRNSDFSIDYYHKVHSPGITLVGAHTSARPNYESYPSYFTHEDDIKTVLRLCGGGRLPIKNLIKETCLPKNCQETFMRLATDKNFPIGVQFDWKKEV